MDATAYAPATPIAGGVYEAPLTVQARGLRSRFTAGVSTAGLGFRRFFTMRKLVIAFLLFAGGAFALPSISPSVFADSTSQKANSTALITAGVLALTALFLL